MNDKNLSLQTSIAPWLSVTDVAKAADFYQAAFDAIETYRLEAPDGGLVVQLAVNGAAFWLSSSTPEQGGTTPLPLGGGTIRMILTVSNPDVLFTKALQAGATEVFPISEEYGWRLGRLIDPFGLHWEIGHPVAE
jgi:PhnB protein